MLWSIATSRDTPTNEALRLRPWLLCALILQVAVGILLLSIQDLWGFMMSMLVAGFGFQVWRHDLDVHWVMCYGTVVLTQAIFDITHLMVRIHHIPEKFFEKYFWLDVALISAPFVSAFQTWIMLRAYASFMEEEERQLWSGYGSLIAPPPGSGQQYGATERAPGEPYDWNTLGRGRSVGSPRKTGTPNQSLVKRLLEGPREEPADAKPKPETVV